MRSILKREVKNYMKNPLLWLGIAMGVIMVFQDVSPYLNIHYLREGETIVNDYPQNDREGDVFDGYVPTEKEVRRNIWEDCFVFHPCSGRFGSYLQSACSYEKWEIPLFRKDERIIGTGKRPYLELSDKR